MILPKNCKNWGQKERRKGGQFKEGGTQFFQKCMKVALLVGGKGERVGGGAFGEQNLPSDIPQVNQKESVMRPLFHLFLENFQS